MVDLKHAWQYASCPHPLRAAMASISILKSAGEEAARDSLTKLISQLISLVPPYRLQISASPPKHDNVTAKLAFSDGSNNIFIMI